MKQGAEKPSKFAEFVKQGQQQCETIGPRIDDGKNNRMKSAYCLQRDMNLGNETWA